MTSMVNEATEGLLDAARGDAQLAADLAAIAALFVLLVETELYRAAGRLRPSSVVRAVDVAAWPLLAAFVVIVIVRGSGLR